MRPESQRGFLSTWINGVSAMSLVVGARVNSDIVIREGSVFDIFARAAFDRVCQNWVMKMRWLVGW